MPERRPFTLVVNPRAGAGRAGRDLSKLEAALREAGGAFTTVLTQGPNDATRIVREAIAEGAAGVAIVGGDGSLNEAINGFFDDRGEPVETETWLGPLPCGTGGDFRKTLGLSQDYSTMATRLLWATPRRIDAGWLTFRDHDGNEATRAFLNIASFGVGGLVDQLVNDGPKWLGGKPAFLLGSVRAMRRYKERQVKITVDDGEPYETSIINCAVSNGQFFGGGMQIAPEAEIDDGIFDVVTLEAMPLLRQARLMPKLYRGEILGNEGVDFRRGRRVVAEPADWSGPVLLDVDGEAPGSLPATFEMKPGAVLLKA